LEEPLRKFVTKEEPAPPGEVPTIFKGLKKTPSLEKGKSPKKKRRKKKEQQGFSGPAKKESGRTRGRGAGTKKKRERLAGERSERKTLKGGRYWPPAAGSKHLKDY